MWIPRAAVEMQDSQLGPWELIFGELEIVPQPASFFRDPTTKG